MESVLRRAEIDRLASRVNEGFDSCERSRSIASKRTITGPWRHTVEGANYSCEPFFSHEIRGSTHTNVCGAATFWEMNFRKFSRLARAKREGESLVQSVSYFTVPPLFYCSAACCATALSHIGHIVAHITVRRFLRLGLRGRGGIYAETCVYARGCVYTPAVYTHLPH